MMTEKVLLDEDRRAIKDWVALRNIAMKSDDCRTATVEIKGTFYDDFVSYCSILECSYSHSKCESLPFEGESYETGKNQFRPRKGFLP